MDSEKAWVVPRLDQLVAFSPFRVRPRREKRRRRQPERIALLLHGWRTVAMRGSRLDILFRRVRAQLVAAEEGLELVAFFESCPSRSAMICALLAVLELVRLQAIVLAQTENFGAIFVRKHKMFDLVFAGGEISASAKTPHTIDEQQS